jgi:hypothetical protein
MNALNRIAYIFFGTIAVIALSILWLIATFFKVIGLVTKWIWKKIRKLKMWHMTAFICYALVPLWIHYGIYYWDTHFILPIFYCLLTCAYILMGTLIIVKNKKLR